MCFSRETHSEIVSDNDALHLIHGRRLCVLDKDFLTGSLPC